MQVREEKPKHHVSTEKNNLFAHLNRILSRGGSSGLSTELLGGERMEEADSAAPRGGNTLADYATSKRSCGERVTGSQELVPSTI